VTDPSELYCSVHVQFVLKVDGGKECLKPSTCGRSHPSIEEMTQKVARASVEGTKNAALKKALVEAIEDQLSP
jgi:hypothetical protein